MATVLLESIVKQPSQDVFLSNLIESNFLDILTKESEINYQSLYKYLEEVALGKITKIPDLKNDTNKPRKNRAYIERLQNLQEVLEYILSNNEDFTQEQEFKLRDNVEKNLIRPLEAKVQQYYFKKLRENYLAKKLSDTPMTRYEEAFSSILDIATAQYGKVEIFNKFRPNWKLKDRLRNIDLKLEEYKTAGVYFGTPAKFEEFKRDVIEKIRDPLESRYNLLSKKPKEALQELQLLEKLKPLPTILSTKRQHEVPPDLDVLFNSFTQEGDLVIADSQYESFQKIPTIPVAVPKKYIISEGKSFRKQKKLFGSVKENLMNYFKNNKEIFEQRADYAINRIIKFAKNRVEDCYDLKDALSFNKYFINDFTQELQKNYATLKEKLLFKANKFAASPRTQNAIKKILEYGDNRLGDALVLGENALFLCQNVLYLPNEIFDSYIAFIKDSYAQMNKFAASESFRNFMKLSMPSRKSIAITMPLLTFLFFYSVLPSIDSMGSSGKGANKQNTHSYRTINNEALATNSILSPLSPLDHLSVGSIISPMEEIGINYNPKLIETSSSDRASIGPPDIYEQFGNIFSEIRYVSLPTAFIPNADVYISSNFGKKRGQKKWHNGIDLAAWHSKPVGATTDMTVIKSGWAGKTGYAVYSSDDDGNLIITGHHPKRSIKHLKKGSRILRGEEYAEVGNSGNTIGENPYCVHVSVVLAGDWHYDNGNIKIHKGTNGRKKYCDPIEFFSGRLFSGENDIDPETGKRIAYFYLPFDGMDIKPNGQNGHQLLKDPFTDLYSTTVTFDPKTLLANLSTNDIVNLVSRYAPNQNSTNELAQQVEHEFLTNNSFNDFTK